MVSTEESPGLCKCDWLSVSLCQPCNCLGRVSPSSCNMAAEMGSSIPVTLKWISPGDIISNVYYLFGLLTSTYDNAAKKLIFKYKNKTKPVYNQVDEKIHSLIVCTICINFELFTVKQHRRSNNITN